MRNSHKGRYIVLTLIFSVVVVTSLAIGITMSLTSTHAASTQHALSGSRQQQNVMVTLTGYGFDDNSGQQESQHGSAIIGFPKNQGNPTLHSLATEGQGTVTDPITFAVRDNDHTTFPVGSLIYVPLLQKYFIMEDRCGDTNGQGCANGSHHVDLWMGPSKSSNSTKLDACEAKITPNSPVTVIINPSSNLPVDTTPMFKNNQCTVKLH